MTRPVTCYERDEAPCTDMRCARDGCRMAKHLPDLAQQPGKHFYADKSDMEVARHINLSLLMCQGISEQNAGFDTVTSLNDAGLEAVPRI